MALARDGQWRPAIHHRSERAVAHAAAGYKRREAGDRQRDDDGARHVIHGKPPSAPFGCVPRANAERFDFSGVHRRFLAMTSEARARDLEDRQQVLGREPLLFHATQPS